MYKNFLLLFIVFTVSYGDNFFSLEKVDNPIVKKGESYTSYEDYHVPFAGLSFATDIDDAKEYIVSDENKNINIWSVKTGLLIKQIEAHKKSINQLLIRSSHHQIISSSDDCSIKIWDLKNGKLHSILEEGNSPIWYISMSPNGKWLVSSDVEGSIKVWNLVTYELVSKFEQKDVSIRGVVIDNSGKYVVSATYSDKAVTLWDVKNGEKIRTYLGHEDGVTCVALTEDKKFIVSGSYDKQIIIWNLEEGTIERKLATSKEHVRSLKISHDDKYILSTSEVVKVWNFKTGKLVKSFTKFDRERDSDTTNNVIGRAKFSSDSKAILISGYDYSIRLNEMKSGQSICKIENFKKRPYTLKFSPDNQYLLAGLSASSLAIWDMSLNQLAYFFENKTRQIISALAMTSDSRYLFLAMGWGIGGGSNIHIKMFDMNTKKMVKIFKNSSKSALERSNIFSLTISPDNQYLATYLEDNSIELWDIEKGESKIITGFDGSLLSSLAFTANSEKLLAGTRKGQLVVIDLLRQKTKKIKVFESEINAISSFGKENFLLSSNENIIVWNLQEEKIIKKFKAEKFPIHEFITSKSNNVFISESSSSLLEIWSLEEDESIVKFDIDKKYAMYTSVVDLTNDGKQVVIGFEDGSIKLFNINNMNKAIKILISGNKNNWLLFDEIKKKFFRAEKSAFIFKKLVHQYGNMKVNAYEKLEN